MERIRRLRKIKAVPVLNKIEEYGRRTRYEWTDEVDRFIVDNYSTRGCQWISEQLRADYRVIQGRALKKLKVSKFSHIGWTSEQIEFLREHYPKHGAPFVSKALNLPITAVQKKASDISALYQPKDRYIQSDGYVVVGKSKERQFEHRLVMEKLLGRPLEPYEIVHHKDGDKGNNDPSNLELTTRADHINHHRHDLNRGK